jgi:hypothetical protein
MKATGILMGLVLGPAVAIWGLAAAGPQSERDAAVVMDANYLLDSGAVQANDTPGDPNTSTPEADSSSVLAAADSSNTFLGAGAGSRTWFPPAHDDTYLGYRAGYAPGMGSENTFTGSNAGYYNGRGSGNTFSGFQAGYSNTEGNYNTFLGHSAGYSNLGPDADFPYGGSYNTFSGFQAGYSNTTGHYNTFLGHKAGYANSGGSIDRPETGCDNTFLGSLAGCSNDKGYWNTFSGFRAGYANATGYANTYTGWNAGCANAAGHHNTFVGCSTGCDISSGEGNTFVGALAGRYHTTGSHNTYVGTAAGAGNTTGGWNVCIGNWAGSEESGSYKLYIASGSGTPLIYGNFHAVQVGIDTTNPTATLDVNGTACVRDIPGGSDGTPVVVDATGRLFKSSSSARYKTDIETLSVDADKVLALRPVHFRWQSTGRGDIGLIAEEVAGVLDSLVMRDPEGRPEAVKYDKVSLYLLSVIQAQQQRLEAGEAENRALAKRIEALEQTIRQLQVPPRDVR